VGPSEMKTACPLQTIVPCSMRRGQVSLGPRFARLIKPSGPTGVPRSSDSPPVATIGASTSTNDTSAIAREAARPPSTRSDFTWYLRVRRSSKACARLTYRPTTTRPRTWARSARRPGAVRRRLLRGRGLLGRRTAVHGAADHLVEDGREEQT